MEKRVLALCLAFCMMLAGAFYPTDVRTVAAQERGAVQDDGNGFKYQTLGDNRVEIVGYVGDARDITIPSTIGGMTVTAISGMGNNDFVGFPDTTLSVTIPAGVTSIGEGAFVECCELASITVDSNNPAYTTVDGVLYNKTKTAILYCAAAKEGTFAIPQGVTRIAGYAFAACRLTGITLPAGVTDIGESAFGWCTDLENITIPEGVTNIGEGAFFQCEGFTDITIPDSVTSIGESAFGFCCYLENITIGEGVTSIGDGAFSNCQSLTSITIPQGVTSIGNQAFEMCTSLEEINLPDNLVSIGDCAFAGDKDLPTKPRLESISIPGSVTSIGEGAFSECTYLKNINIPGSVASIGTDAFLNCSGELTLKVSDTCPLKDTLMAAGGFTVDVCSNHEYTGTTIKAATCTQEGTVIKNCEICRNRISDTIPAQGHTEVTDKAVPATCTTDGKTAGCHCSVCGAIITAQRPVSAKGHTEVTDEAVSATCTAEGKTEGSHCSVCGKVITAQQVVSKKPHSYTTMVVRATKEKAGSIVEQCTVCGEQQTTPIACPQTITLSQATYTYNGKVKNPDVTVKDSDNKTLKEGTDYKVSYGTGRKNVGTYTVTVTFQGNYSGTEPMTFSILPATTGISKVIATKKGFTAKWKKQSAQTSGYEIQYSTDKKFKGKTTKTKLINKNKTISVDVTGLKAKKKYYVRVRTYKIVKINGKKTKMYSDWSKAKTVVTKK